MIGNLPVIVIRRTEDWIAVYVNNDKWLEGPGLDVKQLLEMLGFSVFEFFHELRDRNITCGWVEFGDGADDVRYVSTSDQE